MLDGAALEHVEQTRTSLTGLSTETAEIERFHDQVDLALLSESERHSRLFS